MCRPDLVSTVRSLWQIVGFQSPSLFHLWTQVKSNALERWSSVRAEDGTTSAMGKSDIKFISRCIASWSFALGYPLRRCSWTMGSGSGYCSCSSVVAISTSKMPRLVSTLQIEWTLGWTDCDWTDPEFPSSSPRLELGGSEAPSPSRWLTWGGSSEGVSLACLSIPCDLEVVSGVGFCLFFNYPVIWNWNRCCMLKL